MILDYNYSQMEKELSISYIDNSGNKQIMKFNGLTKIPTYYFSPNGQFTNWDGSKCSKKLTSKPSVFDIKEFIFNLSPEYQKKLENKVFPKLYTFDIETQIKSKYEFTEPTVADMPILTISMVNPELNCVVLGTKALTENDETELQQKFVNYLNNIDFYNKLKIDTPKIRYIKFDSEELMIKYFLEKIVAKVPIIAGWNSIGYDWCYFVHRIKNFYPKLSIKLSSITNGISYKNYTNKKNETIKLPHPNHTLVLDMMDIIDEHDKSGIMPAKESMNLDYVASQTLGANKIEYDGDLQTLYETDYQKYVFYNAIDSILVQLIDKRFKIMHQFYLMSLFCKESIGKCFSKISLTEALVFKYYFENNIKIVPEHKDDIERGNLVGAYVKEPKPGKWNWMCCNDFASLYPSSIITCNLSFDNFLGKLGREFTQEQIDKFKKNKNYFVSVNGCVYKNDKDYTFKIIEKSLKSQRDKDKYLAKAIDATLCRDLKHFLHNQPIDIIEYPNNVREYFKGFGYDIVDANSFKDIQNIDEFLMLVENESTYLFGMEQAVKEMMNSMYGGSSNVSFYWFNMDFANDITGESRWLIHKMEEHIPEHFNKEWLNLKDVHKKLGIEVDENVVKEMLKNKEDIVTLVYGDTDSLYSSYENLLKTVKGYKDMTTKQLLDIVLGVNLGYLDEHNCEYIKDLYNERHGNSFHKFELETVAKSGVWLDVKKRYGQLLLWKDGNFYDEDDLPIKVKGLEVIKASYPTLARKINKEFLRFLLEYEGKYLAQELSIRNRNYIEQFKNANIEDICANIRVNKYTQHVASDNDPSTNGPVYIKGATFNSKALAMYNWINNTKRLGAAPIYGGKVKCYTMKGSSEKTGDIYFAFESMNYPAWADTYAPADRMRMYQKYVLDSFNRILSAINLPVLNVDGSIQLDLF